MSTSIGGHTCLADITIQCYNWWKQSLLHCKIYHNLISITTIVTLSHIVILNALLYVSDIVWVYWKCIEITSLWLHSKLIAPSLTIIKCCHNFDGSFFAFCLLEWVELDMVVWLLTISIRKNVNSLLTIDVKLITH